MLPDEGRKTVQADQALEGPDLGADRHEHQLTDEITEDEPFMRFHGRPQQPLLRPEEKVRALR